jgi:ribose transport system ATP-binding protein
MSAVVEAMVGSAQSELFPARPAQRPLGGADTPPGVPAIQVNGVCVGDELSDVTFTVRPGEIVGLVGLERAGTATVLGVLFGTRRPTAGTVPFSDGRGAPRSSTAAARRRISLVPADRRQQGLMLERSVGWNAAQVRVGALRRRPWLRASELRSAGDRQIANLGIKAGGADSSVAGLSGGNQQKVVIGKWLEIAPRVFLLDDPTRGVDVGAKREIYQLIRRLADSGGAVVFRSTELPELTGLADRVLVFYRGRLTAELAGGAITDSELLHAVNTGAPIQRPAAAVDAAGGPADAG